MEILLWIAQGIITVGLAPFWLGLLWVLRNRFRTVSHLASPWRYYRLWWDLAKTGFEATDGAPIGQYWVPPLTFATQVLIGLMIPAFYLPAMNASWFEGWHGDWFLLFSLSAIPLLANILWLDPRLPFTSKAVGRQTLVHVHVEPILVVILFCLARICRVSDIAGMFNKLSGLGMSGNWILLIPAFGLTLFSLWYILLALCGRLPFDDPDEDAELSTLEKGSEYPFAGIDLVLMQWGGAIRLSNIACLFLGIAMPFTLARGLAVDDLFGALLLFGIKLVVFLAFLGFWEARHIKTEFSSVPDILFNALLYAVLAFFYVTLFNLGL